MCVCVCVCVCVCDRMMLYCYIYSGCFKLGNLMLSGDMTDADPCQKSICAFSLKRIPSLTTRYTN